MTSTQPTFEQAKITHSLHHEKSYPADFIFATKFLNSTMFIQYFREFWQQSLQ